MTDERRAEIAKRLDEARGALYEVSKLVATVSLSGFSVFEFAHAVHEAERSLRFASLTVSDLE